MRYKSVSAGGKHTAQALAKKVVPDALARYPVKFYYFAANGYEPHVWQYAFHSDHDPEGRLTRFRHLVAGRRGGKTLSAAWEVLFYAMFPEQFHLDAHGFKRTKPLWVWCLAKDYQAGRPMLITFIEVLNMAGLVKDRDYTYNKQQQTFQFHASDSLVEFKTASDPQSLRGAGLDLLWMDEAAFVPTQDAWDVVRPALADKRGLLITTTTPWGRNWLYELFFSGPALTDPTHSAVEFTSIDNPYFPKEEWDYAREHMHPVVFAQEHLASFDSMAGVALNGEWLKYYVLGNPDTRTDDITVPREGDKYKLRMFIGVDPAISLADNA